MVEDRKLRRFVANKRDECQAFHDSLSSSLCRLVVSIGSLLYAQVLPILPIATRHTIAQLQRRYRRRLDALGKNVRAGEVR